MPVLLSPRWRFTWLWIVLLALTPATMHAADKQSREVQLEKHFVTERPDELTELHIHDDALGAQVKKLRKREAKLTAIEGRIAADLSGRLDKLGPKEEESVWKTVWGFYQVDLATISRKLGSAVGFLADEVPAVMRLYWLGSKVSSEIDKTMTERHRLEREYIDGLIGKPKDPKKKGPTFFQVQTRDRIAATLRQRVADARRLRQNKVDNFLLTRRAADETALPTATFERAVDLWTGDTKQLDKLKKDLTAAEAKKREQLVDRESKQVLVRHADKLIKGLKKDETKRKEWLENKKKQLQKQVENVEKQIKAQNKKIADVKKAIEQEELQLNSKKGGVREEPWTRQKLDQFGAAMSSRYAELAIRRRIMKRAAREATHTYELADTLSAHRRLVLLGEQRRAIIRTDADYSGKELRVAYIDQGLVSIAKQELKEDKTFLAQLDYSLRIFTAIKQFTEKAIKRKLEQIHERLDEIEGIAGPPDERVKRQLAALQKDLRLFIDEAEHLKEIGGGAFSVFTEQVKSLFVVSGAYRFRMQVEKTHEAVRKRRKQFDAEFAFLEKAVKIDDNGIRSYLGLEAEVAKAAPPTFKDFKDKYANAPKEHPRKLLYEDKAFFDAVNGGFRRIGSTSVLTYTDRLATEYLIAYGKACHTLKALKETEAEYVGLDKKTGKFSFKLLLSPIRTLVVTGRFIARWCNPRGPQQTEIERWVAHRGEQLEGMRLTFAQLRKAEFDWPKVEAVGVKAKHWWHRDLLKSHPDYRRFWHTVQQEKVSFQQAALMRQRERAIQDKNWMAAQVAKEKLEAMGGSTPSPKFLAAAHFQDALDSIQLYNYPAAKSSLITANELDSTVVSTKQVETAEQLFAWWETGAKYGQMATEIGDQIVWHVITQGTLSKVIGPYRDKLASLLKVKLPPPDPTDLVDEIANIISGYFNPLQGLVSVKTFRQKGLQAGMQNVAKELGFQFAEDEFKDELLIRRWKWDPEIADRVAGSMFSLLTQALEATYEVGTDAAGNKVKKIKDSDTYKRIQDSALYYYSKLLSDGEKAPKPKDLNEAAADGSRVKEWEARRTLKRLAEAEQLAEAISKLLDQDTEKAPDPDAKKKPDDPDDGKKPKDTDEELTAKVKRLRTQQKLVTEATDGKSTKKLLDEHPFDSGLADRLLEGELDPETHQRCVEDAIRLLEDYQGRAEDILATLSKEKKPGEISQDEFLRTLDAARQVLHRECFNTFLKALGGETDVKALLKAAGFEGEGISPARMKEIMQLIQCVVPTGSGGYLSRRKGGEYKPWASDLDFTLLLKKVKGIKDVTAEERVVLEKILGGALKKMGKNLDTKKLDMAFMADSAEMFTGRTLDRQSAQKVIDDAQKIVANTEMDPEVKRQKLTEMHDELEAAYNTVLADLKHPERYRQSGRLNMLWYLTALGDHVLVVENGKFKKKYKKDIEQMPEEAREVAEGKNAELREEMGWEVILDDAFFAGKKAPGLASDADGLDKKPGQGLIKEIGKRNIRELVGFACKHPLLRAEMNRLLGEVAKGKYVDHRTFCVMLSRIIKKHNIQPAAKYVDHILLMGRYKNDPDPDMLVKRKLGYLPEPDSPEYRKVLADVMKTHTEFATVMAQEGLKSMESHLQPLFKAREDAAKQRADLEGQIQRLKDQLKPDAENRAEIENKIQGLETDLGLVKQQAEMNETLIKFKLTPVLAGFKYFGGHLPAEQRTGRNNTLQKQMIEHMLKAGASFKDIEGVFQKLEERGVKADYQSLLESLKQPKPEGNDAAFRPLRLRAPALLWLRPAAFVPLRMAA